MAPPVTKDFKQYVHSFGPGCVVPTNDRNLLGGKGKGLVDMSKSLPVPPGMVITTEACVWYRNNGFELPPYLEEQVLQGLRTLEGQMKAKFGCPENPLLVSCRSGARVSMPGMMDTILNLGLNDAAVKGFAKMTNNERLAYDSYRRFIDMFANVVEGVPSGSFEHALSKMKAREGVATDVELSVDGLKLLCEDYKAIFQQHTGQPFPQDPMEQLRRSIRAVFASWDSQRAVAYRRFHRYPDDWGTAVVVMAMVFGNKGNDSATGVGFTRDPATGERRFYGEFLPNAQGEDVVAGIRTPHPINLKQKALTNSTLESLEEMMPSVYRELERVGGVLEREYKEMQDIEFTIDAERLFMLQTRTGKRTGIAAVKIACDMLREGLIDEKEALLRVDPAQLVQLLTPVFDPADMAAKSHRRAAKGLNAGPGAACGKVAFTSEKACEWKAKGEKCVLLREETSPEDFAGIVASEGTLTMRGGATSHAAVVARGIGKPCVCGCGDLQWLEEEGCVVVKKTGEKIREGDVISIDGTTGHVFLCAVETRPSEVVQVLVEQTKKAEDSALYRDFATIMTLADKYRRLGVRANADTPQDAAIARAFGGRGIGLVRTEHMFMEKRRLLDVRCMLFAETEAARKGAVERLLPYQRGDFAGIFRAMRGCPVTIRLLDPPRHEFLPHTPEEEELTAKALGVTLDKLRQLRESCAESNPMLGHRGCRLGIAYPYLTEMQVRAIFEAAVEVTREDPSQPVTPEVMVPIVSDRRELVHQRAWVDKVAKEVFSELGMSVPYTVGTMIELPRAALQGGNIAETAEFFSFGTNDLTQCTYGISRDDANQFLPLYIEGATLPDGSKMQIADFEPFQTLDTQGVGELMQLAVQRGRTTRPGLKTGICGEHGGDGPSVKFCHTIGLDYVSCSPFRVPIARLAAGQAAVEEQMAKEKRAGGN